MALSAGRLRSAEAPASSGWQHKRAMAGRRSAPIACRRYSAKTPRPASGGRGAIREPEMRGFGKLAKGLERVRPATCACGSSRFAWFLRWSIFAENRSFTPLELCLGGNPPRCARDRRCVWPHAARPCSAPRRSAPRWCCMSSYLACEPKRAVHLLGAAEFGEDVAGFRLRARGNQLGDGHVTALIFDWRDAVEQV